MRLWKRWKLSNLLDDKRSYKEATDNCKRAIHKFHAAKELALIRKNNLSSFFNFINRKLKSNNVSSGLKLSDGTITTNPNEKVKAFNSFFGNVFTQDNRYCPDVTNRVAADRLSSVSFTPNEVRDVLRKLKPTAFAGSDNVPNIMLRKCANHASFPLCHIFNISFLDSYVPDCWKYGIITPVHKKGPTSDPNNVCPISMTARPTCCRVMERIINNSLLSFLLDRHLITKQQHSFIRRKSLCTNLLESLEDWTLNLQSKLVTDVIFFDFKKVFDTVCHHKLLIKLKCYGICGNLLASIEAFLLDQSVCIGDTVSTSISVISGVPQNSVLGPTLFYCI